MKKLYALFGVLMLFVVFLSLPPAITAQFPLPIWRNLFTTNTNPRIIAGDATMNVSSNAATGIYTVTANASAAITTATNNLRDAITNGDAWSYTTSIPSNAVAGWIKLTMGGTAFYIAVCTNIP